MLPKMTKNIVHFLLQVPRTVQSEKLKKNEWKKIKTAKEKRQKRNDGCVIVCDHEGDSKICQVRSIPIESVYAFCKEFWSINGASIRGCFC